MQKFYHTEQPSNTKVCAMCKIEKPLTEFHKMKSNSDGFRNSCKSCRRERSLHPVIDQQPLFLLSKTCTKCSVEKDIEEFNKMASGRHGYHSHCKQCQSEYNHQHRIDNLRSYRERAHIKNAKPETKARQMEKHRERSINDPAYLEMRKQRRQRYYQKHKDKAKDFYPRRRARILNAQVDKVDYNHILERDGYFCYICQKPIDPHAKKKSGKALSFDHVIPLQPRLGEPQGTHSEDNLRPTHHSCNVRKGNRPFELLTPYDRRGID